MRNTPLFYTELMEAKSNILKKEELLSLLHPATLSGFQPLKEETNNRLILKGCLGHTKEPLVIKIFKRPHFSDQLKYLFRPPQSRKEWQIGQKLSQLGIPTPSLVAYLALRKWCFLVQDLIVFRELSSVEPLIDWVEKNVIQKPLPRFERHEVIQVLGRFVRRIHDQGVFSNDFHQGNILIHTEKNNSSLLYLTDLHAIEIKKELSIGERVKTLAQLNNFRIPMADRLRFLKAYLQRKGQEEIPKKNFIKEIELASFKSWQKLWRKRKKRSLRPGKGLEAFEVNAWKGMIRKGYDVKNIFFLLNKLREKKRKTNGANKGFFLQEEEKNFIVCYYRKTGFKRLVHFSPAKRTWITMHNLIARGIPTVVPVAFGERKQWGIVRDCFLVFEKNSLATPGDIFLKKLSATPLPDNNTLKKNFVFRLAQLVRWMHQTGICHSTLKPSDIGVTVEQEKVVLHVVNMDGVMTRKNVGVHELASALGNINVSFLHALEPKDQIFFFRIYAWKNTFFKNNEKKIRDAMRKLSAKHGE